MNIQENIKQIATLRETKGKEQETLALINRTKKEAIAQKDYKSLVKLDWEESLVYQHIVMDKKVQGKAEKATEAIEKMTETALHAHEIIEKQKLSDMLGLSHRFLGRCYTYQGNHEKAQEEYEKALDGIQQQKDTTQSLEIRAFLAHALIMNGEINGGLKLALQTFEDFENTEKGKALKEKDYFTWAVWRSGIIPRVIEALKNVKANFDIEVMKKYLDKTEEFLKHPQGNITWGDPRFQFRLDEVNKARQLLK